jgi:plasmid stabilization system protein ParE
MRSLIIKTEATKELLEIESYLNSQFADQKVFDNLKVSIYKHAETICEFPYSGEPPKGRRMRHHVIFAPMRRILIMPYYMYYTFDESTVYIEHLIHTKRRCDEL